MSGKFLLIYIGNFLVLSNLLMIFIYKLHWIQSACERLGVARTLIVLLRDVDKDTNLQATLALRHLFESARCRNQFTDLGVFFHM